MMRLWTRPHHRSEENDRPRQSQGVFALSHHTLIGIGFGLWGNTVRVVKNIFFFLPSRVKSFKMYSNGGVVFKTWL